MSPTIHLPLLLATLAVWVGRQQTCVIQYFHYERSYQGIGNRLVNGADPELGEHQGQPAMQVPVPKRSIGALKANYSRETRKQ